MHELAFIPTKKGKPPTKKGKPPTMQEKPAASVK